MTGHLNFVFFSDRNNAFQKILYSRENFVAIYATGLVRFAVFVFGEFERTVTRSPTAITLFCALIPNGREIII